MAIKPLSRQDLREGPDLYYTKSFRQMIEVHLEYLKKHPTTTVYNVQPHDAHAFVGDLFGLFYFNKFAPNYHWIIARMNGFTDPRSYDGVKTDFLVPEHTVIIDLERRHKTLTGITV